MEIGGGNLTVSSLKIYKAEENIVKDVIMNIDMSRTMQRTETTLMTGKE